MRTSKLTEQLDKMLGSDKVSCPSPVERDVEENCRKGEGAAWIWNVEGNGNGSQGHAGQRGEGVSKALFSTRREWNDDDDDDDDDVYRNILILNLRL